MGLESICKDIGLEVKQETIGMDNKDENGEKAKKEPALLVPQSIAMSACKAALIPSTYIDTDFNSDAIKESLESQWLKSKRFQIYGFKGYMVVLNSILTIIRSGAVPDRSYLIGAPNSCGKTAFAITAIKLMYAKGMATVPFVSLQELSEAWVDEEKRLLSGISSQAMSARRWEIEKAETYKSKSSYEKNKDEQDQSEQTIKFDVSPLRRTKEPQYITGRFSWTEYINSEILFCFLTSAESKQIESHTLKTILRLRAAKGKPTIVLMSESLQPYLADKSLYQFVWSEIEDIGDNRPRYDRLTHISCYKRYSDRGQVQNIGSLET